MGKMMQCLCSFIVLLFGFVQGYYPPEQIHISLGGTPDCITFNWVTWDTNPSVTKTTVKWSNETMDVSTWTNMVTITNGTRIFIDHGSLHTERNMHQIEICNLDASTYYYYQVGDNFYGLSSIYSFKTAPNAKTLKTMQSNNIPLKLVILGDMGDENAQALSDMTEEALSNNIDMILHVGDLAYDFFMENGTIGDNFMNDIQTLATHVPYMVSHGNHENHYNFSHYTARFNGMPVLNHQQQVPVGTVWTKDGQWPNNWYFSWNFGNIHFITISAELYYSYPWMIETQYNWLIKDLTIANQNRSLAPWIIVNGHRPIYCGTYADSGSDIDTALIRNGVYDNTTGEYLYGLENVFYNYGIDFYFAGHVHNYERMYDIYQNMTYKSTKNMKSTSYIITGIAGCDEGQQSFLNAPYPYDAFRTKAYSYTRFYVYNNTHIKLEQVLSDNQLSPNQNGQIIDQTWYIQENHGPFSDIIDDTNEDANSIVNFQNGFDQFDSPKDPQNVRKPENDPIIPYLGNEKINYARFPSVEF